MDDERRENGEEDAGHEQDKPDRTEQLLEIQRSLEEALERYADLYDSGPVPYVTLTHAGLIDEMNLPAAELLDIDRLRCMNMPFRQFVDEADQRRFRQHLLQCQKYSGPTITELTLRTRDGRQIPVELSSGKGHLGKHGYVYSTALISLLERRKAETDREELLINEQRAKYMNEAKDRFVAVLSHELRNPLSPVIAALAILEHEPLSERGRQVLHMMRRNLDLEVRLIDDLLDVSRISSGKLKLLKEAVDVDTVIRESLDMVSDETESKGLRVETALVAPRHTVFGDFARLQQILLNLLRNALKFTHEGTITIRTRNRLDEAQGSIIVEVQDTGIGIPQHELDRLFEPLAQVTNAETNRAGLGLGLAICRGLVEAHGGRIWVKSEGLGKGSTFSFEMSLFEAPQAKPKPERRYGSEKVTGSRGLSILLVEDQKDTAFLTAQLLEAEGHNVKIADSVHAALDLYRQWPADLFIGDIGLPDGSGFDLMQELQSIRRIPGIAVSGFGTQGDVEQSRKAGFSEHITKPVHFERLLEAIGRAISNEAGLPDAADLP